MHVDLLTYLGREWKTLSRQLAVQGLMQENARLWSEREAFAASQACWNPPQPAYGPDQWLGVGVGGGQGYDRNCMGAVMDVLKASVGSLMPHQEQSLYLGALAPLGDRGSGFPFSTPGSGVHGGHGSFSRANLMDLFNMVSGGACTMAQPAPGGWQQARTGSLGDATQAASGSGPGTGLSS